MKPMTINELIKVLQNEVLNGNGDKAACVSDDDECNGYHCLWGFYQPEEGEPMEYCGRDNKMHTIETILIA